MDLNLTPRLKTKMEARPRVRGRYNSSELYGIVSGWITPEKWFNPPEKNLKEIFLMWNGIGMHNQLQDLMGQSLSEHKREFPYKDIILVAKADYLPEQKKHQVWEFKTSEALIEKAKPWHEYQVKLYVSMFDKEEGVIYQPIQDEAGLFLKCLGIVARDDKWFEKELEKLYEFHLKVEKLWESKNQ